MHNPHLELSNLSLIKHCKDIWCRSLGTFLGGSATRCCFTWWHDDELSFKWIFMKNFFNFNDGCVRRGWFEVDMITSNTPGVGEIESPCRFVFTAIHTNIQKINSHQWQSNSIEFIVWHVKSSNGNCTIGRREKKIQHVNKADDEKRKEIFSINNKPWIKKKLRVCTKSCPYKEEIVDWRMYKLFLTRPQRHWPEATRCSDDGSIRRNGFAMASSK